MISISAHTHPESPLTGSTLAAMVGQAKKLGRTHFAYTDQGHLSSCLKAYGLCKPDKRKVEDLARTNDEHLKKELKLAAGIEFYFKDTQCPLVVGTPADRCRYFTGTIFCKTQASYQELCKIVSRMDMAKINIQEESQSLWTWAELEKLSKLDTLFVVGGIHCMVGKVLLADGPELAEKVFVKIKDLFGDRLSAALICEPWDKKYTSVIRVEYGDGTADSLLASDTVSTDRARKIKASDLIERSGHTEMKSKVVGSTYFEVNKRIFKVAELKGFLPLPGGDVTLRINQFLLEMANKYGTKVIVSDYAFYAAKSDHAVQTMVLEGKDKVKADLHMKTEEEFTDYLVSTLKLSENDASAILSSTNDWAKNFDAFSLKYEYRLADSGGDPLKQCMEIIQKVGRMKWQDPVWTARLREEINVISKNGVKDFSAYFLPICDVVTHYRENGKLTGPSRGSAGGSLFCYVMGITHLNPLKFGLSFPRFLSLDRIKNGDIPDVDTDFPDRDLLIGKDGKSGYLYSRWGNKAAQISTRHMVRLKSAIKDTNRYFHGSVQKEIDALTKALPDPPQGVPDKDFVFGYEDTDGNHVMGLFEQYEPLRRYAETRPQEWEIVQKSLGIVRSRSLHASAFAISDTPLGDIMPTKEGHVTQYEAKQVEGCGILKYDFLTVSNILDIEVCLKLINKKNGEDQKTDPYDIVGWYHPESDSGVCADCQDPEEFCKDGGDGLIEMIPRNCPVAQTRPCDKCKKLFKDAKQGATIGWFTHKGKLEYIWDLPHDPEAFKSAWNGDTNTLFQISTSTMTPAVKDILPISVEDISVILALKRPGPMDYLDEKTGRTMDEEYVWRRQGKAEPDFKELFELIPETYGIITFQEQSLKISKELGGMTASDAEKLRRLFSKKLKKEAGEMKPVFMSTAITKIGEEKANKIWDMMETSSRYSFNASHSVGYAMITYAGLFLRHNYPLEWWAAILTNAKEKEISGKLWPHVKHMVAAPDINLSTDQMEIDYANHKIRAKLGVIRGMGATTIDPIVAGRPYKDIQDFVNRDVAGPSLSRKLIHVGVLDSLFPPHTTLLEKLQLYGDAVEITKYNEKVEKAKKDGKLIKQLQPKKGTVPEEYADIEANPMKNAAVRKAILPSLLVGLHDLGKSYSKCIQEDVKPSRIMTSENGKKSLLITGEMLQRLNETPRENVPEDKYVAVTAFVVETKVFEYSNNTKQALKVVADVDGYVTELVMWPDYFTEELIYPQELKKGNICTIFLKKQAGKPSKHNACSIQSIVIEA